MKPTPRGHFHITQGGKSICLLSPDKQKTLASKVKHKFIHLHCNYNSFSGVVKVLGSLKQAGAKGLVIVLGDCPACKGKS